jgi:hypothetical protein
MRRLELKTLTSIFASVTVAIFCSLTPASGQELVDEHTMAYWTFDEGDGGTAEDSSGNENTGEIEKAEWVQGVSGTALFFDGKQPALLSLIARLYILKREILQ